MKIVIAGAGSGKTTSMASKIVETNTVQQDEKIIFCIAFTNSAVEHISNKLKDICLGEIPRNVKIMTIHSFLYQEIVRPYYYLLYGVNYERVSLKPLGTNVKYHQKEISDLEKNGALHVSAITQRAMWVVKGKSTDRKSHKAQRKIIAQILSGYCGHIFVDEAQDIDDCTRKILIEMDKLGIPVTAIGDPKQDLHGFGKFRLLESLEENSVAYITKCYRCPQKHLKLSNTLVAFKEKQESGIDGGSVQIRFETEIPDLKCFIESTEYDLAYIYKKNSRFDTHASKQDYVFDSLYHLILEILSNYFDTPDLRMRRHSYWSAQKFIDDTRNGKNLSRTVNRVFGRKIEPKEYARIAELVNNINTESNLTIVNSIESIKGKEGDNCLFILSQDLAKYLFADKTEDNKTKAALYVALTRSCKNLTILFTKEAEELYSKEYVKSYFCKLYGVEKSD